MKTLVAALFFLASAAGGVASGSDAENSLTYPQARGAAITDGGRGGDIIRVTNLKSKGAGSLRAALQTKGARIVVFEVGGVIDLAGENISITEPDLTLAGQTAPSPGITIIKGGLLVRTHDVIIQHMRIRPGDLGEAPRCGRDIDAITTIAAQNVIVDHNSLSWATDENLSASGPRFTGETPDEWRKGASHNILFTNNLIAEGLANSTHAKGEHSKGSLIHDNTSNITIAYNLYAHNYERSPLFKGGVRGALINNFIYNPGARAIHYNLQGLEWGDAEKQTGRMAVIGNAMKAGPSTEPGLPMIMLGGDGDVEVATSNNLAYDRWGKPTPIFGRYTTSSAAIIERPFDPATTKDLNVLEPHEVEAYVLKNVGARPWDRDGHDVRVLADTAEGRGEIIDSQEEVGGYPKVEPTRRAFNPKLWDLATMTPRSDKALSAESAARGT